MEQSRTNIALFISEGNDVLLKHIRLSLWVILACIALFGFVDPLLAPEKKDAILAIRFGIMVPILFACCVLSHTEIFKRIRQIVVLTAPVCVAVGLAMIMAIDRQNEILQSAYTQGMVIAVSFAPVMLAMRLPQAIAFFVVSMLSYNFLVLRFDWGHDEGLAMCISTNTLLVMAGSLGIFTRVVTRKLFLKNISKARIIEQEKDKLREQMEEQTRIMNQLIDSEKKLAESSDIKNKLLSLIAHDIKGPLASIRGIVEMFAKGMLTRRELEDYSKKLSLSLVSLNNMLNNLLSWSIVHMDEASLKKELTNLNAIVSENFKLICDQAEAKNNELINRVPEYYYRKVDPSILNLVLRNLISNAVKFTDGGKIVVSAFDLGVSTVINVSDNGVGMQPEQMNKLFNWDERKSSMGTRLEKGSGIGLLITKDFAEKHGGRLLVNSAETGGTTFSFVFPQA